MVPKVLSFVLLNVENEIEFPIFIFKTITFKIFLNIEFQNSNEFKLVQMDDSENVFNCFKNKEE